MIRTFIDSGILIAAARGSADIALSAFEVLDDPNREFVSSIFVKLEVLPKAMINRYKDEVDFYQEFFSYVSIWTDISPNLFETAFKEAARSGLSAIDAIHVVSALTSGSDELITTEKRNRPIHRNTLIPVRSIHPENK